MAKIKERHRRDFALYVRCFRRWRDLPYGVDVIYTRGSRNTIVCFVDLDARGHLGGDPLHPRLLRSAILGKRLLNLQIKEWAQGYEMCGGQSWLYGELQPDLPWLPDWVFEAVRNQYYAHYSG